MDLLECQQALEAAQNDKSFAESTKISTTADSLVTELEAAAAALAQGDGTALEKSRRLSD